MLKTGWKDILLIPQSWYPAESPRFETAGWWYAPAEEVLGRTCKSCRTFYEIENSAGTKRSRRSNVRCPKCQSEKDQAKAKGERGKQKNAQRKKAARTRDASNPRRSERMRGQERVGYHGSSSESDRPDSDDDHEYDAGPYYGIRMRASDPRYITEGKRVKALSLQEPGSGQIQCTSRRDFAPFTTSTFIYIHASAQAWGTAGDRQ